MSGFTPELWFARPALLWGLLLLPALALARLFGFWLGRRRLARLGALPRPRRRPWLGPAALSAGLASLVIGAAGPRGGTAPAATADEGRDLVILLDVSRSMWAEDALPNRFERGRAAIRELLTALRTCGGHRLALVIVAAKAKVLCPLTRDLDHLRHALDELDPAGPPPTLLPTDERTPSGTRFGVGVSAAVAAHDDRRLGFQDIIFLSDGDDPADDGEWQLGARSARQANVAVFAVGLGDPNADSRIPLARGGVATHQGRPVQTRLHEEVLETLARLTGGAYHAARLDPPRLPTLVRDQIEPRGLGTADAGELPQPATRSEWWYLTGLALTLFAVWRGQ